MRWPASLCLVLLCVAGAGARAASAVPAAPAAPDVQCFGALREIIHEGRIEGRARLSAALSRPHAYGLGALARLDGEFVILDGKAYLTRPNHRGGLINSMSVAGADSAALLVFSHVAMWRDIRL